MNTPHIADDQIEDVVAVREMPVEGRKPRHPIIELLARYRAISAAAWAHRDELADPCRTVSLLTSEA